MIKGKYLKKYTIVCWKCGKSVNIKSDYGMKIMDDNPTLTNMTKDFDPKEHNLLDNNVWNHTYAIH